ncbi:hypothetical protein [Paraburkholderia sp. DHOC27]|uniref:hypothetical protein n=1 Tax=Paraburkholderia sp. DHOC27 TaxID=2303330 RepID=UPI000E3B8BAD|nr:hypothetical protein [Paraburkholderia sp. DHOC27]RFU45051.1 hypothetical protein D0B32_25260 [Paraburkholderia sp. DHOC27]
MKFDVATFNSLFLITFLCMAVVTTALSRMFKEVAAFRFWAVSCVLTSAAAMCFGLHAVWPTKVLLVATAVLNLQARLMVWTGTRVLFGATASLRAGLATTALFGVLFALLHAWDAPPLARAALLIVFFLPCRALTLYEVCRRRRPDLGTARLLVLVASAFATLNAVMPLTLVMLNQGHLSMLLSSPTRTSALYAMVFASDLLLMTGLIVLALQQMIVEQNILAKLDKGAARYPNPARPVMRPDSAGGQAIIVESVAG